ncbi:sulfatase family protein [Flammeovirga kamogawensis]|uniref:Sulfatase-like hydrolase/transferase n=1 Tax=Flammeovirga kamogawensis TaxID=373891 RepID=A0ABX8H4B1_9BACT|nr:sulfatase-like hydrolase/transferase [Flammeovirga kamogawensis]MBB6460475.1 arylsulfatase A-like enzyme [Flammeovirga kamogawensis]QWG10281.1 sulfatase-like hydrolase/transferase [Flammeovirga kamogawensis]TRX64729.1 sulfatase-like hydrolase/transferase [Flammeovirga kamogawensis]
MKKISYFLLLLVLGLITVAGIAIDQPIKKKNKSPNLIVIMTDDMGWADVGFNGCKDIPTPNIDVIADQGVKFNEGYVSFPVCGPSRAGFLTGRYQDRFGYTTNPSIDPNNAISGLPVEEETIAQVLNKADYKSAIIGKWHMGTNPVFHPLVRGFDYFYGFLSGGHNYFPENLTLNGLSEVTSKWGWYRTKIIENRENVETTDYLTDELTNSAVKYIKKQADAGENFMVYLAYNAPHTPLQATEKYLSRFPNITNKKRKTYAAMVSAVDDGVGRVLQTLKDKGVDENTIIVFLSDNGGAHNNASDNGPLRGKKGDLFEGGVRVPFAMRWKGVIPEGQTYENAVSSLDIMATIVAQTDVKISKERPLDGVNLIPYLTGKNKGAPHDYLFWRKWEKNAMAVRYGNYKLVANSNQDTTPSELFDLSKDGAETINIKSEHKKVVADLTKEWNHWNAQLKDRVFPTLSGDKWWVAE